MGTLKTTILNPYHKQLGAKMVEFAGWEMPIQYQGIIQEHNSVREHVGVFDVSHMARILIEGADAESLLDFLSTNKIAEKKVGAATYTVWCHQEGGAVDDLIVYRLSDERFFVVVNGSNREKDLAHLQKYAQGKQVTVTPLYENHGILAVQGPEAQALLPILSDMKPMRVCETDFEGSPIVLATTGYTGAGGFEIYAENSVIVKFWEFLMGQEVTPVGLGARDTLRLEMGFALYGHELADDIDPNETVSKWTVKWDKENFLGKEALQAVQNPRSQFGVLMTERGIAREGAEVFWQNEVIGTVTSGTFSPSLQKGIAIVMANRTLDPGQEVELAVRQRRLKGTVVKLPFI